MYLTLKSFFGLDFKYQPTVGGGEGVTLKQLALKSTICYHVIRLSFHSEFCHIFLHTHYVYSLSFSHSLSISLSLSHTHKHAHTSSLFYNVLQLITSLLLNMKALFMGKQRIQTCINGTHYCTHTQTVLEPFPCLRQYSYSPKNRQE